MVKRYRAQIVPGSEALGSRGVHVLMVFSSKGIVLNSSPLSKVYFCPLTHIRLLSIYQMTGIAALTKPSGRVILL